MGNKGGPGVRRLHEFSKRVVAVFAARVILPLQIPPYASSFVPPVCTSGLYLRTGIDGKLLHRMMKKGAAQEILSRNGHTIGWKALWFEYARKGG